MAHSHDCGCTVDWSAARQAAAYLLKSVYRVDLRKVLNPLDDADFLVIVQQLADQLHAIAGPVEKAAVEAALAALDVNLATMTGAEAAQVARAVNLALRDIPAKVVPQIVGTVRHDITETVGQTKARAAATHGWGINVALDAVDQNMVGVISNIGSWVTDIYGKRAAMTELGIQRIIADGVSQGLRNEVIAGQLQQMVGHGNFAKSRNYWNLVATNLSNRARSYGHLRSMDAAGIQYFMFYAVMDERTTLECRALHETRFSVDTGLRIFDDLQVQSKVDPQAVEKLMPFVKTRALGDGSTELYVNKPGTGVISLGRATDSGVGRADVRGTFTGMLSPAQLEAAGVIVPPIHPSCRSTIIPVT